MQSIGNKDFVDEFMAGQMLGATMEPRPEDASDHFKRGYDSTYAEAYAKQENANHQCEHQSKMVRAQHG